VRIYFDNPGLLPDLLASLGGGVIAERVGDNELHVGLVNSMRADEAELELERRLRVWQIAHPDSGFRLA
jgi:hypothetical protein